MQFKYILLFIPFLLLFNRIEAQELNIAVSIKTPNLKIADPKVFKTLESAINEFINHTSWTKDEFFQEEKIEGSMQITIVEDISSKSFTANFQLTTSRPVYNSNYYTPILNILDKNISFSYEQFAPLYDSRNNFSDPLSSILTFYAYVILGFDYDSYAPYGGESFFQIAKNVKDQFPIGSSKLNNDYITELYHPKFREYRQALYNYHRLGLDKMYADPQLGRSEINGSLKMLNDVNKDYPRSLLMQMFTDSKRDEIVEIFKAANSGEKRKVYNIMVDLNPAQANIYGVLR